MSPSTHPFADTVHSFTTSTGKRGILHSLPALGERLVAAAPPGVVARARTLSGLVAIVAACGRHGVPLALVADDSRDLVGELRGWVEVGDDLVV